MMNFCTWQLFGDTIMSVIDLVILTNKYQKYVSNLKTNKLDYFQMVWEFEMLLRKQTRNLVLS